jgi:hypothetical protein
MEEALVLLAPLGAKKKTSAYARAGYCWLLMLYLLLRKYQSELRDMTTTLTAHVQKTTGRLLGAEGAVRSILSL